MTPREKVISAFNFEEVRPTPHTVWYDHESMLKLNDYYKGVDWQDKLKNNILRVQIPWEPREFIDETHFRDLHGSIWQLGEPVHEVEPVLKEPNLANYRVPDYIPFIRSSESLSEAEKHNILPMLGFEDVRKTFNEVGNECFTVVGYGYGIFEDCWMLRGYENFFSDLLLEETFVHELFDLLLEAHLNVVDTLCELPCDGIIFSDDYGDQRGVIIGPDLWRKFVKPRLAKLYERVHFHDKMTFQHTCGSVYDIIPDLIDIGLDVLQSLQPEAMPVYDIKKNYGKDIRLWGGLGTQQLLPFGTPEDIRAEVRKLKQEMGTGGGYVFTSSKPIMKEVPVENAVALIDEVLNNFM